MAFAELKYFSPSLAMQTAATFIMPENTTGPLAVFYLLHGLSDDHTIWGRRTAIERYVEGLPLLVVMPNGGRGFYTDAHIGGKWESAIISDLIPFVDSTFRTRAERGSRCIGGLSMGGYGAVKLALKNPELFASANSHSGAVAFAHGELPPDHDWHAEFRRITGPDPQGGPNDCFALASQVMDLPAAERPLLRIDCGTEDYLLANNRLFHEHLKTIGYTHEYEEFPGAHNWPYWDLHVQEALAFHTRNLGLQ